MDAMAMDLPNFLAHELFQQLVSLDGLLTGVQTPTTHTLTPATTLSAIVDLEQSDESYHNEAGFVPPVISAQQASTYLNMVDTKSWQGGSTTVTTLPTLPTAARPSVVTTSTLTANIPSALPTSLPTAVVAPTPVSATTTTPVRRNVGGRRPTKAKGISPEEEERRQVRRERNKAAAARCRKRRMDHTNELIKETEDLERKKQGLQNEIQELNDQLEELTYILDAHRATGTCRHTTGGSVPRPESPPDIKPVVVLPPEALRIKQEAHVPAPSPNFVFEQPPPAKRPMLAMTTSAPISVPPPATVSVMVPAAAPTISTSVTKPLRPTSLPVPSHIILKTNTTASEVAGIPISTPSTGIPFNFDSLMEGGTGLTPVSGPLVPSCSSQQRNHNSVDLASPDASIGNKLVSL